MTMVKVNTDLMNSQRRPDIDVIRIVLTWAILLFHTALIFSPLAWYYVKIVPDPVPSWHLLGSWFTATMDVWQMPMFFFLSGIRSVHVEDCQSTIICHLQCILRTEQKKWSRISQRKNSPPPNTCTSFVINNKLSNCIKLVFKTESKLWEILLRKWDKVKYYFLAPSGAQGVAIYVCPSRLELSILIFLAQLSLSAFKAYFIRMTEPKILRFVYHVFDATYFLILVTLMKTDP